MEEYLNYNLSQQIEQQFQEKICNSGKQHKPRAFLFQSGTDEKRVIQVQGKTFDCSKMNTTWTASFPPDRKPYLLYREEIVINKVLQENNGLMACKSEHGTTYDNVLANDLFKIEILVNGT